MTSNLTSCLKSQSYRGQSSIEMNRRGRNLSFMHKGEKMILAGADLAWQSEKNPSAIAFGTLEDGSLSVDTIESAVYGINNVLNKLSDTKGLKGIAIDAPLIIKNPSGQRPCEKAIGKIYGSRKASCHTSNTKLYPHAKSVYLSERLVEKEFHHIQGVNWQIECYPHPAIIEIFGLPERLKYKKGNISDKRAGQKELARLLKSLATSSQLRLFLRDGHKDIVDGSYIDTLSGKPLKTNEDVLDSLVCLYIAGLYAMGFNGQIIGDIDSGYIWVPCRKDNLLSVRQ